MERLGLVLSGGSCRCAFQAGVLQALHARGLRFAVVGAVSSGVWNATAVATGAIDRLASLWLGACDFPVYSLRNLGFNRTPWNYLYMHHHFTRRVLDFARLREAPVEWLVGVTRLRGLQRVVMDARSAPDPFAIALASNTIPPIYPWPARLQGGLYVDGGFTDNLIYEDVLARCDRVVMVVLTADGSLFKNPRDRRHVLPAALRERIHVIHPQAPLTLGFNDLDRGRVAQAMDAGRRAGASAALW
jgi:predicted acylesterase/phospholipase RssA